MLKTIGGNPTTPKKEERGGHHPHQKILLNPYSYYPLWKKLVACVAEYSPITLLDVVLGVDDSTAGTASSSLGTGTFSDMLPYA